jgi:hypothetical protein
MRAFLTAAIGLMLTVAAMAGTNIVATFELTDQFGRAHSLSFPREKVCVLLIGDREGSRQLDGWTKAIAEKFGDSVDIYGLADLREVPRPIRPLIRDAFKKKHEQPVLLDWDGAVASRCGYARKEALVLVVGWHGEVLHRATGKADTSKLDQLFVAIAGKDNEAISISF